MRPDQFIQANKFEPGLAEADHEFEVGRPNSQKRRMSVACNYSSLNMIAMNMYILSTRKLSKTYPRLVFDFSS